MMKKGILLMALVLNLLTGSSQNVVEKDFKACFEKYGVEGCFVLYDEAKNTFVKYNASLCDSGYLPASTFKIPNSLIALEEGIIRDTTRIIKWNGHEWPNKSWNQDQTLKTAMKYSCVWVYTGFATQIGIQKYYEYITKFDYGNKNLTGPPSRFWLAGLLRISANQQIEFLRKFYNYELPVSRHSVDVVKDIIVLERSVAFKMSGKTGGGMLADKKYIMWLVGYVERNNTPYFYALNFVTSDFDQLSHARYEIARSILRDLKLID
jgi:beta-lactamase class D